MTQDMTRDMSRYLARYNETVCHIRRAGSAPTGVTGAKPEPVPTCLTLQILWTRGAVC
jgi:hypothetical protein